MSLLTLKGVVMALSTVDDGIANSGMPNPMKKSLRSAWAIVTDAFGGKITTTFELTDILLVALLGVRTRVCGQQQSVRAAGRRR